MMDGDVNYVLEWVEWKYNRLNFINNNSRRPLVHYLSRVNNRSQLQKV